MNQDSVLERNEVYSAMESGTPYGSYIKTIWGRVRVTVWDSTLEKPVDIILQGDPKKKEPSSIVQTWNIKEDSVFKRLNAQQFKKGLIIAYTPPVETAPAEKAIEQASDEELKELLKAKFFTIQSKVNKIESVPVLFRMKSIAEEMDKHAITEYIEKRISEIQQGEFEKYKKPSGTQEEE